MAAKQYLSDVLQMLTLSEVIQNLPPELLEIIYKHYLLKLKQRADLGWNEVHKELGETPFCQEREMLVKVKFCLIVLIVA